MASGGSSSSSWPLGDALGGGIDGGELGLKRWRVVAVEKVVFRVIHLQAAAARPRLAVAAHPGAGAQIVFLGGGKVKETQGEGTGVVLDLAHQAAAARDHHVAELYLALHHHIGEGRQCADGGDPGAVQIPVGKMEQHVLDRANAQFRQFFLELRADPPQCGDRESGRIGCRVLRHGSVGQVNPGSLVSRIA